VSRCCLFNLSSAHTQRRDTHSSSSVADGMTQLTSRRSPKKNPIEHQSEVKSTPYGADWSLVRSHFLCVKKWQAKFNFSARTTCGDIGATLLFIWFTDETARAGIKLAANWRHYFPLGAALLVNYKFVHTHAQKVCC
jgi:hypothetical protein